MRPYKIMSIAEMRRRRRIERTVKVILVSALAVLIGAVTAIWIVANAAEPHEMILAPTDAPEAEAEACVPDRALEPTGPETAAEEPESIVRPTEETGASAEPEMRCLGTFTLTAYCGCETCCGRWAGGPTASGVMPEAGRTIAVDTSVIPMGSKVYIEGLGECVAEDTGSAIKGNRIDIYMDSHKEALGFADGAGSCKADVYIICEKGDSP